MRITRFIIAFSLLLGSLVTLSAQKFGHVNSAHLVEIHPGIAKANIELDSFRKSITDPFDVKTKAFQSKYQFFQAEVDAGTISKVTAQSRQEELQKEQQDLNTEGQQIQFKIYQKREELLKPILGEVDSLIQVIGKEGKYTMIFDNSVTGALLFANQSEDLTEQVRARIRQ